MGRLSRAVHGRGEPDDGGPHTPVGELEADGEHELRATLVQDVLAAPDGLEPVDVLLYAFRGAAGVLEANRPFSEPRLALIAATPALRERDLAKGAAMSDAVAEALRRRGIPDRTAHLAAHIGWAAFHHAAQAWIDDGSPSLDPHLRRAFDDLRALFSAGAHPH